jgi:hypothetical protein
LRRRLASGFGSELLARSFSSGRFTSGLLQRGEEQESVQLFSVVSGRSEREREREKKLLSEVEVETTTTRVFFDDGGERSGRGHNGEHNTRRVVERMMVVM